MSRKNLRVLVFIFFLFPAFVLAQDYRFRMEGNYAVMGGEGTRNVVEFNLSWNEEGGIIQGSYQDDHFTQGAEVTGTAGETGRSFNVIFPEARDGVKSLTLVTSDQVLAEGGVPLTATLMNPSGIIMQTANSSGVISETTPEGIASRDLAREIDCSTGLGALQGMCGLYLGSLVETYDTGDRCIVNDLGTVALELYEGGTMNIYMNYINTVVDIPRHSLGSLYSPANRSVNLTNRNCGSLVGTTYFVGNCQRMNLTGTFSGEGPDFSFSGTYKITDEQTGETCSYTLDMVREIAY